MRIRALVASLALAALPARAQADDTPHPITLQWDAPPACPDGATVLAEIDRLLGGRPQGDRRMVVDALARPAPRGAGWQLQMTLRDNLGEGERDLEGATCAELADVAALVVALAFDAEAVAATRRAQPTAPPNPGDPPEPVPPSPTPSPPPPPTPPTPPPVPPPAPSVAPPAPPWPSRPPPPPASSARRLWWTVGARAGGDLGSLPSPSFVLGGVVGLRYHPVVVRVRASYHLPVDQTLEARPEAGGRFDLWTVAPVLCLTPWRSAVDGVRRGGDLALDTCAEIELGSLGGTGFGVRNPRSGRDLWVTPAASARLEITAFRWGGLGLDVGVGFPVRRREFALDDVGIVYRAPPVVGRLGLEIMAVF